MCRFSSGSTAGSILRGWGCPSTIAVGLVDGFDPHAAMWVLLLLLSILVNLNDRWKIVAIAGTFVVVSGAAYYAFMAAWLNVFESIGYLRGVQVALGLVAVTVGMIHIKDFVAFKQGVSLSIPAAAKPGIYQRIPPDRERARTWWRRSPGRSSWPCS